MKNAVLYEWMPSYKQRLTKNGFIGLVCACASYVILGLVPKMNLLHIEKGYPIRVHRIPLYLLNEWMNEWTNLLFVFIHWVPPCRHEVKKKLIGREQTFFNRASPPVIICISFYPLAHPLRKGHEPGPVFYCTLPRLYHAPVQPRHPPPIFWAGPPIP